MSDSEEKRRIKIYTKTGDKGTTSLYTGERKPKDDNIFEALGTVDELTSMLGEYALEKEHKKICLHLESIQCCLQDVNSNIATPRHSASEFKVSRTVFDVDGKHVNNLEEWIDEMDKELPALTAFILPSGGKAASTIHVARTICRRAERRVVGLAREGIADNTCSIYLNRLSDYLFTAARFASLKEDKPEVIWRKQRQFDLSRVESASDKVVASLPKVESTPFIEVELCVLYSQADKFN